MPDVTGEANRRVMTIQRWFERFLSFSRLLTLIPVIFLLFDAAGSFIYGSDILIRTADGDLGEPSRIGGRLGIFLIVMDTFLVGATLLIAAFGFYELFVIRKERPGHLHWLPSWLVMRDLEDLKARVTSMLILVAAITFVDILVESHDERGILFLGIGVAVIIVGLTIFLRFGRREGHGPGVTADPVPADGPVGPAAPDTPGPANPAAAAQPAADPPATDPPPGFAPPETHPPKTHGDRQPRRTVVAIGSLSTLDLREGDSAGGPAAESAGPVTVRLVAILGQVTVLLPPGMQVADSGLTFLGARSVTGSASAPGPATPILVTTGASVLGRVKIKRALPGRPLGSGV
ncbi:MAG TPA: YqhA family protein [Streptosporangiaceae bacterium]|nr:YqhA family protein [Streptosporangiaceae bacterium]